MFHGSAPVVKRAGRAGAGSALVGDAFVIWMTRDRAAGGVGDEREVVGRVERDALRLVADADRRAAGVVDVRITETVSSPGLTTQTRRPSREMAIGLEVVGVENVRRAWAARNAGAGLVPSARVRALARPRSRSGRARVAARGRRGPRRRARRGSRSRLRRDVGRSAGARACKTPSIPGAARSPIPASDPVRRRAGKSRHGRERLPVRARGADHGDARARRAPRTWRFPADLCGDVHSRARARRLRSAGERTRRRGRRDGGCGRRRCSAWRS